MKDLGQFNYCLGLEVWRDNGSTLITQRKYINEVLKRFHMKGCKAVSTPLEQNIKLRNDNGTKKGEWNIVSKISGKSKLSHYRQTRHYLCSEYT